MSDEIQAEPYDSLERRALRDLAARVIADPSSPDEHVEAATRVLECASESPRTVAIDLLKRLPAPLMQRWRDVWIEISAFLDANPS